jgi:hypothetical protein
MECLVQNDAIELHYTIDIVRAYGISNRALFQHSYSIHTTLQSAFIQRSTIPHPYG